jgi:mRNA interferase MazF
MMSEIQRGEIWWADLPQPRRSEPGYRRSVLVVQADSFNSAEFRPQSSR